MALESLEKIKVKDKDPVSRKHKNTSSQGMGFLNVSVLNGMLATSPGVTRLEFWDFRESRQPSASHLQELPEHLLTGRGSLLDLALTITKEIPGSQGLLQHS